MRSRSHIRGFHRGTQFLRHFFRDLFSHVLGYLFTIFCWKIAARLFGYFFRHFFGYAIARSTGYLLTRFLLNRNLGTFFPRNCGTFFLSFGYLFTSGITGRPIIFVQITRGTNLFISCFRFAFFFHYVGTLILISGARRFGTFINVPGVAFFLVNGFVPGFVGFGAFFFVRRVAFFLVNRFVCIKVFRFVFHLTNER